MHTDKAGSLWQFQAMHLPCLEGHLRVTQVTSCHLLLSLLSSLSPAADFQDSRLPISNQLQTNLLITTGLLRPKPNKPASNPNWGLQASCSAKHTSYSRQPKKHQLVTPVLTVPGAAQPSSPHPVALVAGLVSAALILVHIKGF